MATIKVKFRPSTVAGQEGSIYYQILHERKPRQLSTDYKIFPSEWDEKRGQVVTQKGSQDKMANRRKALKSLDFQCFSFLPKFQIRAEYRGGE